MDRWRLAGWACGVSPRATAAGRRRPSRRDGSGPREASIKNPRTR